MKKLTLFGICATLLVGLGASAVSQAAPFPHGGGGLAVVVPGGGGFHGGGPGGGFHGGGPGGYQRRCIGAGVTGADTYLLA